MAVDHRAEAIMLWQKFMMNRHTPEEQRNELLRIWRQTGIALNAQDIAEAINNGR